MAKIKVQNTEVTVITYNDKDYISLTDMVRNMENGPALIEKWLRNKNTVEFLGIWEEMYNPDFNSPEFEGIKNEAGLNRFILSVKQWVEKTNSKGIIAKGRTLWRDLRTQGYRVRVRHVGIPSIQAVPAERVPAVERGGAGPARLECETGTVKDQLPHTYRCHQAEPDTGGSHPRTGRRHLCGRGGRAQRGHVRDDRQDVA